MGTSVKFALVLTALLLAVTSASSAWASDCRELLRGGVFNTFTFDRSEYSEANTHQALCNGKVFERSERVSGGGGGGFSIGIPGVVEVGLFGSGESANAFQESYQAAACGESNSSTVSDKQIQQLRRTVDPGMVDAYVECMRLQSKGVRIEARVAKSSVDFQIRYDQQEKKGSASFDGLFVTPQNAAKCRSLNLKSRRQNLEPTVTYTIHCERTAPAAEVTFSLHTDHGVYVHSMPAEPPPPTQTALVLRALPRGTILGLSSSNIPDGWALCDGSRGTVDLTGRFPVGAAKGEKAGTKAGNSKHVHTAQAQSEIPRAEGGGVSDGYHISGENRERPPQVTGLNHAHRVSLTTDEGSNLPPSTRVIFICRL